MPKFVFLLLGSSSLGVHNLQLFFPIYTLVLSIGGFRMAPFRSDPVEMRWGGGVCVCPFLTILAAKKNPPQNT